MVRIVDDRARGTSPARELTAGQRQLHVAVENAVIPRAFELPRCLLLEQRGELRHVLRRRARVLCADDSWSEQAHDTREKKGANHDGTGITGG